MKKSTVKSSIKSKIIWLMMVTNFCTLFISLSAFWLYDFTYTKQQYSNKHEMITDIMDPQVVLALKDNKISMLEPAFESVLKSKIISQINLFDAQGNALLAMPDKHQISLEAYHQANAKQHLFIKSIYHDEQLIGFMALKLDNSFFITDVKRALELALVVALFISLITYFISKHVAKVASRPVEELTRAAKTISEDKDFTIRAEKISSDELGVLTEAFNTMLDEIDKLQQAHHQQLQIAEDSYAKVKFLLDKTEITKRKLEEEALQRFHTANNLKRIRQHLDNIINSMPSVLVCVDKHLIVKEWNSAAKMLTGLSSEQAHQKPLEQAFELMKPHIEKVRGVIASNQTMHIEKFLVKIHEQEHYFDILMYPLCEKDDDGVVIRLDDVTTQVRMENMMVQTEKMMSVGGLAAGMAHEINNPLGGILQSAQNLIRRIDPNMPKNTEVADELGLDIQKMNQYLEQRGILKFVAGIQDSGERAAKIVRNMLQFSRKNDNVFFNQINLNDLLDRSINLATNDYDLKKSYDFRQIEVQRDYETGLPFVPCISSEIEQVVLNLLRNAAQAMHEAKMQAKPTIIVKTYMDKDYAHIQVIDNGPGMDKAHLSRIFEPFFTTKEVGVGTGLGLSVSFFIIESKHHGKLSATSEVGVGTTFTISLPLERVEKTA